VGLGTVRAEDVRVRVQGTGPVRRVVLPAALLLLVLAGCAAGRADSPAAATSAAATSAVATTTPAAGAAPAAAQMVCSDEIRRVVTGALALGSIPPPASSWADSVYTCTYALPAGSLTLSVVVAGDDAAARAQLDTLRSQLGAVTPEPGLGERAWSTPDGTVLAVKDDMVLHVDATALPDDLGPVHEHRIDVARVLAAAVFDCWTGNS
jgi:hypothetical protein